MPYRRRPYIRETNPPPFDLTKRDKEILETIYAFDGMMSLKQIDRLFFSGKGRSQPRARMRVLFDNKYVTMPDANSIHKVPVGETVYWLDIAGSEAVAPRYNEKFNFPWRDKIRWAWIEHDLAVNDFRIRVMESCNQQSTITLMEWTPETDFLADPDTVVYTTRHGTKKKRQVQPDGFFLLEDPKESPGQKGKQLAFLLEIDMASHSNPRFARQKARAGLAYLKSEQYQQRFGLRFGRWLIVTTGMRRLKHLKSTTERAGGQGMFYFTTFEATQEGSVLTQPIWYLAGEESPRAIIPNQD